MKRLFDGRAPLDPGPFQFYVLERLRSLHPDRPFAPSIDPQVIRLGELQLGLQNLYATYRKAKLAGPDLDELVRAHFEKTLENLGQVEAQETPPWSEACVSVRPQLMPVEYTQDTPVVHFPFPGRVRIGMVLDDSRAYSYLRQSDLAEWGQPPQAVYDRALANLEEASSGIQVHAGSAPDRYLAIEAKDGYDAARILLPGLRRFIIERLGEPFLATVPNRDFLVAWAAECSSRFHEFARAKAQKDFAEQPYPLTPEALRVSSEAIVLADLGP